MKGYLVLLLALILLAPIAIISNATTAEPYQTVQIPSLTIYKDLTYHVVAQKTLNKTKVTTIFSVNYEVTSIENTTLSVSVSGNFTKNMSYVIGGSGNFSVNIFSELFSLHYPFIPPFLEFNNTYGLNTTEGRWDLQYLRPTNVTIMNKNVTASAYIVYFNQTYSQYYVFLKNGLIANTSYSSENGSQITMLLVSYSNPVNITFNAPSLKGIGKPYLYIQYINNFETDSLTPEYYLEVYYPYQVGDYLVQINYLLYPQQGSLVVPANLGNIPQPINFVAVFAPYYKEQLTFVNNVGNSTIIWKGVNLTLINTTYIKTINGTDVKAYLYKYYQNSSVPQGSVILYVYFSSDGTLLQQSVYSVGLKNITVMFSLVSNEYVSLDSQYPTLTKPLYTTLPYEPVNLSTAILITVIISVVISALIVVLRQR